MHYTHPTKGIGRAFYCLKPTAATFWLLFNSRTAFVLVNGEIMKPGYNSLAPPTHSRDV